MKKVITIILIAIVCIYVLLFVSPYFIKNHLNEHSEEYIGRKAKLEELSFNPFTFQIHAANFQVLEKDNETVFLGFRQLDVNLNLLKRLTGVYQVEEISLDSPFVNVINYGDGFNFDDLLTADSNEVKEEKDTSETIAFEILNMSLSKGEVIYYDKVRDNKVDLDDLSFVLPQFAYNSESANMDLQLVINESGRLSVNNNFFPKQNRLECNLKLAGLDLEIAKPYVADYVAFNKLEGKFGANLDINILLEDSTDIFISGASWLTELGLTDSSETPYFKLDSLHTQLNKLDILGQQYNIGHVLLNGMYFRYEAFDSITSLDKNLAPLLAHQHKADTLKTDSAQIAAAVDTVSKVMYSIDTVLITESHIQYFDYKLDESFEYNTTGVTALGTNIRSDSSKATFSSNGVLNEVGTYNANLILPPQNPLNFDLDFAVEKFQMGDISPFILTYAGHPIFDGNLVYKGHTVVHEGIMQSENKVIIYDLEVGDKAKGNFLVSVPIKFAVFLLKDKDGVVNLDMPMEGNLHDPEFKVGPLIWQIVKQNLEKAVAAPGKILATQYGIDPKEIQYIAFNPLDTALGEAGENTLLKLEELVTKKPGLIVDFSYYEPSNIEVQTYAYQKAKEQYVQAKLKYRVKEEFRNLVNKTGDQDVHFINYMNEELGTNSSNTDSLALALIGVEEAIKNTSALESIRVKEVVDFLSKNDFIKEGGYKFSKAEGVPEFPAKTSGFIIGFGIQ